MKPKYRIKKYVSIDETLGRQPDGLYVTYKIERKVLWWWETMQNFYGYDGYYVFDTKNEAKGVLTKHIELEKELKTDQTIVDTIVED